VTTRPDEKSELDSSGRRLELAVEAAFRFALSIAAAAALLACAPKQKIPLACVPRDVVIYVDGTRLEKTPSDLDLRSDEPHTLYFKGPDFKPELVVLDSEEIDGKARLSPSEVCVKPRYVRVNRELTMEIDPDVSAAPPPDGEDLGSTIDVEAKPDFAPESP
jgi:hypothetical protein